MLLVFILHVYFSLLAPECIKYTEISDNTRRWNYGRGDKCDSTITKKWYRFTLTGKEDIRLNEIRVPNRDFCDTRAPGRLVSDGKNPTVADGIVSRTVCFDYNKGCQFNTIIRMRNCRKYFIYELVPTTFSPCGRYCTT